MEISNLSPAEVTKYARQMALKGWDRQTQERLKLSRVLIVGAGGLGATAALYLLTGGVGAIRLVDGARVNLAGLSHQILYREQDLGKAKAMVAARRLQELNSFTLVESLVKDLSARNVFRLSSGCQVLLDATNNPAAGLLLNQAAIRLQQPLVHARVQGLDGQLTTYWPGRGPCLACSAPEPPRAGRFALLSPLPGILGALLALEALRILGGLGAALLGRVLAFDGSACHFTEKSLQPNPQCPACRAPGRPKPGGAEPPGILDAG